MLHYECFLKLFRLEPGFFLCLFELLNLLVILSFFMTRSLAMSSFFPTMAISMGLLMCFTMRLLYFSARPHGLTKMVLLKLIATFNLFASVSLLSPAWFYILILKAYIFCALFTMWSLRIIEFMPLITFIVLMMTSTWSSSTWLSSTRYYIFILDTFFSRTLLAMRYSWVFFSWILLWMATMRFTFTLAVILTEVLDTLNSQIQIINPSYTLVLTIIDRFLHARAFHSCRHINFFVL